jgi:hypothetical protein
VCWFAQLEEGQCCEAAAIVERRSRNTALNRNGKAANISRDNKFANKRNPELGKVMRKMEAIDTVCQPGFEIVTFFSFGAAASGAVLTSIALNLQVSSAGSLRLCVARLGSASMYKVIEEVLVC